VADQAIFFDYLKVQKFVKKENLKTFKPTHPSENHPIKGFSQTIN
jgi:hypothetical protein